MMALFFLMCIVAIASGSESGEWNYDGASSHGPPDWAKGYPKCGEKHQSPIDIIESKTVYEASCSVTTSQPQPSHLQPLVTNNGHSVSFSKLPTTNSITKGSERYILDSFHFHWSQNAKEGSEHLVDGEGFDAEMHLVHYNDKYASVAEARDKENGLAVVAYLLVEGNKPNKLHDQHCLEEGVLSVAEDQETKELKCLEASFNPYKSLSQEIFCYRGSLTTPPCSETVQWLVNHPTVYVSKEFMAALRTVKSHNGLIISNRRPAQALNGRTVSRSFEERE